MDGIGWMCMCCCMIDCEGKGRRYGSLWKERFTQRSISVSFSGLGVGTTKHFASRLFLDSHIFGSWKCVVMYCTCICTNMCII